MSPGPGFETMQPAGTAIEPFLDFHDKTPVGKRTEPEGWDGGAVYCRYRRVNGRSEMHGRRIIHIIHGSVLHQGRRLKKGKLSGKIGNCRMGSEGPDFFTEPLIQWSAQQIDPERRRDLVDKADPFILRVLFGEPDGCGRN